MNKFRRIFVLSVTLGCCSPVLCASNTDSNGASVDIGLSCNQMTLNDDKTVMKFLPIQGHPPLCIQRSSVIKNLPVRSTKVFLYEPTRTWWLTINFPESSAFLVTSITSKNVGREMAIIKGHNILTSGLIVAPISDAMYSVSLENEIEGKKIQAQIDQGK